MRHVLHTFAFVGAFALVGTFAYADVPVGSVGALAEALGRANDGTPFDLVATVAYVSTNRVNEQTNIAICDGAGHALVRAEDRRGVAALPEPGDRARVLGFIAHATGNRRFAVLTNCQVLAHGPKPKPIALSRNEMLTDANTYRYCRFTGMLRDVAINETSPGWLLLTVCDAQGMVFATVPTATDGDLARLREAIGTEVTLTGICVPYDHSTRLRTGRIFKIPSVGHIERGPEGRTGDGASPSVAELPILEPADFAALGRHRATGRIIAVTRPNRALLRDDTGVLITLELADDAHLPRYGDKIEAVGLPETDTFQLILYHATWRHLEAPPMADETPEAVPLSQLTRRASGRERISSTRYGHALAIEGLVRSLSPTEGMMSVDCNGTLVTVDASVLPDALNGVAINSTVRIAGICTIHVEAPRMHSAVPRITGFAIVVRKPTDVTVLAHPSWWTPFRLTVVIGALFAFLFVILVWNALLHRVAERRAEELTRETMARATADLKIYERTRLAVELHDSIAQNLTGISLEIDTATRQARQDPDRMMEHLGIAARALKSCRDELRNALWDLRHETLEADSMETAIRQTLEPHTIGIDLGIRFRVPRERISDNTAHAILRIVRELTVNAIRHGRATAVRVAGSIEGGKLLFSVRDNGCGFDPENCPGDEQGHYGLLGIRERINSFEGQMEIASAPGTGTKVTIRLGIPQENENT